MIAPVCKAHRALVPGALLLPALLAAQGPAGGAATLTGQVVAENGIPIRDELELELSL